jgi:peptidoglycan hydrolase-like protein with peptidoglycan-binding domain
MPQWKGIIGRGFRAAEFKEYVGTLRFTDWRPQFAVVHNTSAPRLSQWHSHPGEVRMRNLESYYRDDQHWSAGPHLFVADDLIWVFTPLTTSGTHSPSWNGVSWGMELVGEYDEEPFNPAVRENAVDALATLHAWRGLDPDTIHFHKEDPLTTHKSCPGKNVNKADLIARVKERMNSGTPGEHSPAHDMLEIGASISGVGASGAGAYTLQSPILAADPALAEIAARDVVLHQPQPSRRVPGIGTIQQAINRLAEAAGQPRPLDLGANDKDLGIFGPRTRSAIEELQRSAGLGVDGTIGDDTLKALDAALVAAGVGGPTAAQPAVQPAAQPTGAKPVAGAPPSDGEFVKTRAKVFNRGTPKPAFLQELVAWGKTAPAEIFADNQASDKDVYASVTKELGPFGDLVHRKACMLEVMRVLSGFESGWDWNEGIDTTRVAADSATNSEAGAWQVSSDSLAFGQDLKDLVKREVGTLDGLKFQKAMKANHPLAMEYVARLMRHTMKHNGPLYRDRSKFKGKLRDAEQSIYPWLSRAAVAEFQRLLA